MKPLRKHRILVVNFKTYPNTIGAKSVALAKALASVDTKHLVVAVGAYELGSVARRVKCTTFAQHVDPITPGRNTGWIAPEHIKAHGAKGTLINHSEHTLDLKTIKKIVELCKKHKLIAIVCAPNVRVIKKVAKLQPDYIAYEPPALIGGNISVTSANPKIIAKAVAAVNKISKKTRVLCGAGVKTGADVKTALELGCYGVLVASGVVKAKQPKKALKELHQALLS